MPEATSPSRWTALRHLTQARFKEFFREPAAIFWVYGFPLLLAIILGLAFRNRPVERLRVDLVNDGPGGTVAAEKMQTLLGADERVQVELHDAATARNRLRTAKTDLVLTPASDAKSAPDYLTEPNRPEAVLARNAVENVILRQQLPNLPTPNISTIDETGSRYIDFLIPGLVGLNLMGGGLFGVGFLIVDLRVRKLLKRFLATPMRKSDFMMSLMLSRFVFMIVEISVLLLFAWAIFGVHVQGNFLALVVVLFAGGICFTSIGLLLGSRAKTLETVAGMMNAIMLPMYLVSGVFFSYERFPTEIHPIIKALPLTPTIDGLRAIMNDGAGFEAVVQPVLILGAWTLFCATLATRLFRWR